MNKPLELFNNNTLLEFLFLFCNADGFYISARHNLQNGFTVPGCINAHQAIELYLKAILKLDNEKWRGHNIPALLKNYASKEAYFLSILNNPSQLKYLQELSNAYIKFRYGEVGAKLNLSEIIGMLDELAYNLRKIYLTNIKSASLKIYIPKTMANDFLEKNTFFKRSDLTYNELSRFGPMFDLE